MKRKLHVYAEQDAATGLWTIDVPELFIIGAQANGSLHDVCQTFLPSYTPDQLEILDMSGAWPIDYDGEEER